MQEVSALYQELLENKNHRKECKVEIGGVEFGEDKLVSLRSYGSLFKTASIGHAVSRGIEMSLVKGDAEIPRMAEIKVFVRLSYEQTVSEWLPKGVFYIDTRKMDEKSGLLTIRGFDAMLKSEQTFLSDGDVGTWPRSAPIIVNQIAAKMGVTIDQRTVLIDSVMVPYPNDLTCRELLGQIAVAHAGNWVMSDGDKLLLVGLNSIPTETSLMVDEIGDVIKLGEVAILVG